MTTYLSVTNWEEHQHYKHRDPPWIKFYCRTLDNHDLTDLPDNVKWHACGLLLLAARTKNMICPDPDWIKKRIGAKTAPDIKSLVRIGFLKVVETTEDGDASTICLQDASTALALVEKSRGEKRASASASANSTTPGQNGNGECPERLKGLETILKESKFLNQPALFDWEWWDQIGKIFQTKNLDYPHQLYRLEEYCMTHPAWFKRTKDWKCRVRNWLSNAF